jgi:hypothetical protein
MPSLFQLQAGGGLLGCPMRAYVRLDSSHVRVVTDTKLLKKLPLEVGKIMLFACGILKTYSSVQVPKFLFYHPVLGQIIQIHSSPFHR